MKVVTHVTDDGVIEFTPHDPAARYRCWSAHAYGDGVVLTNTVLDGDHPAVLRSPLSYQLEGEPAPEMQAWLAAFQEAHPLAHDPQPETNDDISPAPPPRHLIRDTQLPPDAHALYVCCSDLTAGGRRVRRGEKLRGSDDAVRASPADFVSAEHYVDHGLEAA